MAHELISHKQSSVAKERLKSTCFLHQKAKEDGQNINGPEVPSLKRTASLPLKMFRAPKRKRTYSNHPFSGAKLLLVLGRVTFFGQSMINPGSLPK